MNDADRLALQAKWEEDLRIVMRVRKQDRIHARLWAGEWVGGPLPYGYQKLENGQIVEHPTRGPLVRKIFELATEEQFGAVRIASYLNEHYPNTRYSHMWRSHAVEKVLTNRVYCGYLTVRLRGEDGRVARTLCKRSPLIPQLISNDLWERLVSVRTDRRRGRVRRSGAQT